LLAVLKGGTPSHKVEYDHCVGYFDSHKASGTHAKEWCGKMESQLAATVKALAGAAKAAPNAYFQGKVKPRLFELAIDSYRQATLSPKKEPFKSLSQAASSDLSKILPPLGAQTTKYTVPPYTAYEWMTDRVMEKVIAVMPWEKSFVVAPALAKLEKAGCRKDTGTGGDFVSLRCDTYDALAECKGKLDHGPLGTKSSHSTHCSVNNIPANKELAAKIVKELGSKRCQVTPDGGSVVCTRPWKQEKCKVRIAGYKQISVGVACYLKEDPPYVAGKKLSRQILDTLNGVKKIGGAAGKTGKVEGLVLVPPVKPCGTTWDPLAIACQGLTQGEINASLAASGTKLDRCPPDPNHDGADAPCEGGPLSIQDAGRAAVPAVPVPLGGTGGGQTPGRTGASAAPVTPSRPGALPPTAGRVQAGTAAPAPMRGTSPSAAGGTATFAARGAAASPEIVSGPRVTVAGRHTVAWGQALSIADTESRRALNGICEVAISHEARNAGVGPSGPFSRRWVNRRNPAPFSDDYSSIPAGGSMQKTDTLPLKPGVNQLTLTLDPRNQVKEGNERNNEVSLTITVTGRCGMP
ncbi:MAG TPA: hypothetical protein VFF01_02450, partial [Candidatus Deferrimicrobiaceae bacterium]|nr:hypothetical protein [Candidatus Deferrimicrobiaceae bacterium]